LHGGSVITPGHRSHLGGTWIRPRQRALTAIFPHNANKRFLIPKRELTVIRSMRIGTDTADLRGFVSGSFGIMPDTTFPGGLTINLLTGNLVSNAMTFRLNGDQAALTSYILSDSLDAFATSVEMVWSGVNTEYSGSDAARAARWAIALGDRITVRLTPNNVV